MGERLFNTAAGILAGILFGLVLLVMMINIRFTTSGAGFIICLITGFFLPFCLRFRNSTYTSVLAVLVSFAVTVIYAYYVGSHSAEPVEQQVFIRNVLNCTSYIHASALAGALTDWFIRAKESDRINKGL